MYLRWSGAGRVSGAAPFVANEPGGNRRDDSFA